ncbi:ferritin-like domain-containing protein [Halorientalis halophila]|uniref:YciE/YciF ferroxidase family protein n=1 Tax=Halorientalis halophila TaxID=3108499 RepID=UPI00300A4086
MAVEALEDLFLNELKDIYDAEHRLTDALSKLADHAEQEEIVTAFEEHEKQTEDQIERLETVFEAMGESATREECMASKGMVEETEHFLSEMDPSQEVKDRYAVTAAQKTERYEITVYENMLQWANEGGMHSDVSKALRENLDEEIQALQKLQGIAEEFDYAKLTA